MFQRERLNGHYGVASFVVANTLSSAPFLFLISALPGAIAYFLVDLHHGFDHFAYFVLTLYSCMLVVESLMMMVASIVPDFLLGIITGAGIQVQVVMISIPTAFFGNSSLLGHHRSHALTLRYFSFPGSLYVNRRLFPFAERYPEALLEIPNVIHGLS